jgi:hypothetical protein
MSYTSVSVFSPGTKLAHVQKVIYLLGYIKVDDGLKIPDRTDSCYWYEVADYQSHAGVELNVYLEADGTIKVSTRSRVSRSYWDLIHQNKTLKLLRDLFKGYFTTDAGRNRYYSPDGPPPSPLASGCYLARWRYHNSLIQAKLYLMHRTFENGAGKEVSTGISWMDEVNPRLLSNNFILPFAVAVWEDYFRSTFTAALRYSKQREAALKRARLTHANFEQIAVGEQSIEQAVAESFSFQRPSLIHENFRLLDPKIDIGRVLRKPYKRRKVSLFDSLESLVEDRNEFVHTGRMNFRLFDAELRKALADFEAGINRVYECVADHYGFFPEQPMGGLPIHK